MVPAWFFVTTMRKSMSTRRNSLGGKAFQAEGMENTQAPDREGMMLTTLKEQERGYLG